MRATEYLGRLRMIDVMISNKQAERQRWIDMATGTTAKVGGERVQSSSDRHTMERQVVEAAMIDEEIASLKAEKQSIIKTIERLEPDEYDLLHKVYVQGQSLKAVAVSHGMSYSWATTMHRKAKRDLEKLI